MIHVHRRELQRTRDARKLIYLQLENSKVDFEMPIWRSPRRQPGQRVLRPRGANRKMRAKYVD